MGWKPSRTWDSCASHNSSEHRERPGNLSSAVPAGQVHIPCWPPAQMCPLSFPVSQASLPLWERNLTATLPYTAVSCTPWEKPLHFRNLKWYHRANNHWRQCFLQCKWTLGIISFGTVGFMQLLCFTVFLPLPANPHRGESRESPPSGLTANSLVVMNTQNRTVSRHSYFLIFSKGHA